MRRVVGLVGCIGFIGERFCERLCKRRVAKRIGSRGVGVVGCCFDQRICS